MQTPEFGYMTYFGRFGFSPGFNLKAKGRTIMLPEIDLQKKSI
jgi:hypothetical protein